MTPNSTSTGSTLTDLASQLAAVKDIRVETDKPLAPFTWYRIGGPTALWVAPQSEEGLQRALEAVHCAGVPLFLLGRGSNLLVSDRGWPGVTVYIGENFCGMRFTGPEASVKAGTRLLDLIRAAVDRGLGGMEPMAGIPGGVGGAVCMNAGAFGREIESLTLEVEGFRTDGRPFRAPRDRLGFAYRCVPELEGVVVTAARFRFQPEDPLVLNARTEEILALRERRQPLEHPSCGSVFKRPPGYYAGALIEEAGLKGERVGGAEVSRKHAGFILNVSNATAEDVFALIRRIEQRVFERFGVRLEREVKLVGDFGEPRVPNGRR
jgi:UDP-N-acetylmuramate dehydrogenase